MADSSDSCVIDLTFDDEAYLIDRDDPNTGLPAAEPALLREFPPLPPSAEYGSFDDLLTFLQDWGKANGMAFVKKSASNYRDLGDGKKVPTYRPLLCDRGPRRPSREAPGSEGTTADEGPARAGGHHGRLRQARPGQRSNYRPVIVCTLVKYVI